MKVCVLPAGAGAVLEVAGLPVAERTRRAGAGAKNRVASGAASSWRSGVASSRIQKPRPCVATRIIEPSGRMAMSQMETGGRPVPKRAQVAPVSVER